MSRLLVLGNAGLDIGLNLPTLPRPGETLLGRAGPRPPGGKGLNQAVVAAHAGLIPVLFCAPVGGDEAGRSIAHALEPEARQLAQDGMAAALYPAPTGIAIVTLGDEGCLVNAGFGPDRYPAPPTDAVDTMGAGNTFCGVLAAALASGRALAAAAIEAAQRAAALTVTRSGVADALPTAAELGYLLA